MSKRGGFIVIQLHRDFKKDSEKEEYETNDALYAADSEERSIKEIPETKNPEESESIDEIIEDDISELQERAEELSEDEEDYSEFILQEPEEEVVENFRETKLYEARQEPHSEHIDPEYAKVGVSRGVVRDFVEFRSGLKTKDMEERDIQKEEQEKKSTEFMSKLRYKSVR